MIKTLNKLLFGYFWGIKKMADLKAQKLIKRIKANWGLTPFLFLLFLLAGAFGYADDAKITKTVEINYLGDFAIDNTGKVYIVQGKNSLTPKLISACSTPTISISVTTNSVCIGQRDTLKATGASSYIWSTSDTTATIVVTPTATTVYTVTGTTGTCTATQTVTITVNPHPLPTISVTPTSATICARDTAILIAKGATTYTWSTGATTATITPSPTITSTFTVTGTDTNNCVNTDTIRVTVNKLPTVTAHLTSTFTPICSGDTIVLSRAGANTYTWTSTSYTFTSKDSVANGVKFPPKLGTDTFNVKGRDSITGCVNTATISIVVKKSPNVMVSPGAPATICPGGSATFTVSADSGVVSYTWSPTTNLSPSANSTSIIVSPTVTTFYQVIGKDTNGCTSSNEAIVIIPQDSIVVNSPVICLSNSVTLNASSTIALSYTWSPATGLSSTSGSSVIANPRNTTVYTISGTDAFGCTGVNTATVTVDSLPIISISKTPTITCSGTPAVLMASAASTYTWSTGTVGVTNTVYPTTNTEYTVVGTDTNGCSNTATQILLVNPLPPVAINGGVTSVILNLGQSVTLNASGALTYSWTSGNVNCDSCASNTETPIANTQYCVTGIDINGCKDSVCLHVVVENVCDVFIPDAFSPNGDGQNDEFKVYSHCITALTLQIFDRWGNQVFNGSNASAAWDGTYGGSLMNTGSYIYQVQYTLSNGKTTKTKGNFSLMR
jgi:gliding motility-associated-like protein